LDGGEATYYDDLFVRNVYRAWAWAVNFVAFLIINGFLRTDVAGLDQKGLFQKFTLCRGVEPRFRAAVV
jgi:hypothetical protein